MIGVGGDPSATPALVRRLEHEEDEGVLAGILLAIGRLASPRSAGCARQVRGAGGLAQAPHAASAGGGDRRDRSHSHARRRGRCWNSTATTRSRRCDGRRRRRCNDHAHAQPATDAALARAITHEVAKRVVGQEVMVERLLIGLLTGGHVLLEGVPGPRQDARRADARRDACASPFSRIQFTPDLLPADVIGTMVFDQRTRSSIRARGPDLRQPRAGRRDQPRAGQGAVGAARGDAGEAGHDRRRDVLRSSEPFLVLATQNPIEQEGTYPLPEAQLDRFMLKVRVGYPTRDEEKEILRAHGRRDGRSRCERVAQADDILAAARSASPSCTWTRRSWTTSSTSCTRRASPQTVGLHGPQAADRVRRVAPRVDRARAGRPRARLPARPRLRACPTT